jgi:hypothetical protein
MVVLSLASAGWLLASTALVCSMTLSVQGCAQVSTEFCSSNHLQQLAGRKAQL